MKVYPITLATDAVGSPIGLGDADADPDSIAITPDGSTAFVVAHGDGSLIPIDLSTDTAGSPNTDVGFGALYVAISPDGSTAYVSNNSEDQDLVSDFDTATNSSENGIAVDSSGSGSIAIAPDAPRSTPEARVRAWRRCRRTSSRWTASPVCANSCGQLAITPDQAPVAALSVSRPTPDRPPPSTPRPR